MVSKELLELAMDKLRSSGLDHIEPARLGIEILNAPETAAVAPNFPALPALRIRYWDPRTKGARKPLSHRPLWPPFERIRIIGPSIQNAKGKELRYLQAPNLGVCAYFPPNFDWEPVLDDPFTPIFITEGELKAAKGCDMGLPCIGLGGVSNISSQSTGVGFLPELAAVNWIQRNVYIVFDNDGQPKPDVLMAINRLGTELEQRGAVPWLLRLPIGDGGTKVGLDDYFVQGHTLAEFMQLVAARESLTLARELWKLNEQVVKVLDPSVVVIAETGKMLKLDAFKAHWSNVRVPEQVLTKDGEMSLKQVPLGDRWLTWGCRRSVTGITYVPGGERFIDGDTFNTWTGWGCEPRKGDVEPFKKLLDHIFGNTKEGREARRWMLQWLAYPLQHPGTKLYTSVLLWSHEHGTGKTLIGYVMREIYGWKNTSEIGQKHMHGDFNGFAENKAFIIGDEITGSDRREVADQMKSLITQTMIRINQKHIPEYDLPNLCNFYLTSNRASAIYVEDDDRRYFVWEVQSKAPLDFFREFDTYYKSDAGKSAIHHYLLSIDTRDFNPLAPAPMTEAKARMFEDSLSSHGAWARRLKDSPDAYLRVGKAPLQGDLYTAHELLRLFEQEGPTSVKANTLGMELKAAGIPQLPQLRWGNPERRDRFFAVRNAEMWLKAPASAIKKHLETTKGMK